MRCNKARFFYNLTPQKPKQFRKIVKLLNKQKPTIPTLNKHGTAAMKNSKKANMLNQYFSECFSKVHPPLTDTDYAGIPLVSALLNFFAQKMKYSVC